MARRDLILPIVLAVVVVATTPAYARVFSDTSWRSPALLAAGLALLVGALANRVRVPWPVALVLSAVGLAVTTSILFLPGAPLVPGTEQLDQVRALAEQATTTIREEPAPTAVTAGLAALITAGFWVVAAIAHEVAVRFRRPATALIPFVVLWAVPLSVPLPPSRTWPQAVAFLAAAGLVLLVAGSDHDGHERMALPRPSGVGLGAGALSVAVLLPALLPGYGAEAWIDVGPAGDPRGYQPIVDVTDRLQLPAERDLLRVRADQPTYLRLAGLESFDGATWRLGPSRGGSFSPDPESLYPAQGALPPEVEAPTGTTEPVRVEVEVLELDNIYVPAPYQPVRVTGDLADEMVWSTQGGFLATWATRDGALGDRARVGVREGVEYQVDAARPAPEADDITDVSYDADTLARYTALPDDYDRLAEAARDVYERAGAETVLDRALALQGYFAGENSDFTYDLDVPALRGGGALERFVLEDQVGYCEYFAAGMAVMLRATGIPARVATGFLPGEMTDEAGEGDGGLDEYTVTTSDAHAWVEVLFPGQGWVTFEPTPRSDESQIVPRENELAPVASEADRAEREADQEGEDQDDEEGGDEGEDEPEQPDAQDPQRDPRAQEGSVPGDGGDDGEGGGTTAWALVLAVIAIAVLGALVAARRRAPAPVAVEGPAGQVLRAQRRLLLQGERVGLARRPHETTADLLGRWREEGRIDERGDRFVTDVQAAAFGGEIDQRRADDVDQLATELSGMLRASVTRQDRTLAPVRVPIERTSSAIRRARARARPSGAA